VDIVNLRASEQRRVRMMVTIVTIAVVVGACGDGGGAANPTATTAAVGDVVFGSGEIPDGFPGDFPIPDSATIGSTLVDRAASRYEVLMVLPAEQSAAIVYFETNLPSTGYDIVGSGFDGAEWRFQFEGDSASGGLFIKAEDSGVTTVAVDLTTG